jgi:hypothetical protein
VNTDITVVLAVNSSILLALVLFVARLAFAAGILDQRVREQSEEIKRLRDKLDKSIGR